MEVFVESHGLAKARGDTIQNDIDQVLVSHLSIEIKSIDIVQVFLDSISLFEITDLVKSPVQLVVVIIVFPNGILNLFPGSIPVPISFPPFQCFAFGIETNVSELLLLVVGLGNGEVGIHLKYPCLQILHITTEFYVW